MTAADIEDRKKSSHITENGVHDDFSDPEDFVDHIPDEDLADLLDTRPSVDDSAESIIIVDGIPIVEAARFPKLKGFLTPLFEKVGKIANSHFPTDESGGSKGYCFIEYINKKDALDAVQLLNGHRLDKKHTMFVNAYSDIESTQEVVSKQWTKPEPREYTDHGNLQSWLQKPECVDQFFVQFDNGNMVVVYENSINPSSEPTVVLSRERWTEASARWSTLGTYLATFHPQGIALWAGPELKQFQKFPHSNVTMIDFSTDEKYIVTYSPPRGFTKTADALRIFEVRTGETKKCFSISGNEVTKWPYFKWSYDDEYFASMKENFLNIYKSSDFQLIDNKAHQIVGIGDFSWSPTAHTIAYWSAEQEQGNKPANVSVIEVPSKRDMRTKALFKTVTAEIEWQKRGDYVAFIVDRYQKKTVSQKGDDDVRYQGITHNIEIFRLNSKGIPNDTVEVKAAVRAFQFEPNGSKFVLVSGEIVTNVELYNIHIQKDVQKFKTLETKFQVSSALWSPNGGFFVVTGQQTSSGHLMFVDANDGSIINTREHLGMTDCEWDPTGRYVVSSVSKCRNGKGDYGYIMWNFQGQMRTKVPVTDFYDFRWRPRPALHLSDSQIKEVRKNLKSVYWKKFEERDRTIESRVSKEILAQRQKARSEFEGWRKQMAQKRAEEKTDRLQLRNDDVSSKDVSEEIIEVLINRIEKPAE